MKVKSTKCYEVYFDDKELVEALVYWIANVRGRQDMIDVSKLMHNAETKVVRKGRKVIIRFSLDEDDCEF